MVDVVRSRSVRRRKHHHVRRWTRLEPPVSAFCTVQNSSTDKGVMVSLHLGSQPTSRREQSSAVGQKRTDDIVRCCGVHSTAHIEHDRACGSFRSGTLHQSCACTHRHRVWFLFCLSPQLACDFIPRRHQCLCLFSLRGSRPMVGLRASQFGTALKVPPGEASYTPKTSDTYLSGASTINVCEFAR